MLSFSVEFAIVHVWSRCLHEQHFGFRKLSKAKVGSKKSGHGTLYTEPSFLELIQSFGGVTGTQPVTLGACHFFSNTPSLTLKLTWTGMSTGMILSRENMNKTDLSTGRAQLLANQLSTSTHRRFGFISIGQRRIFFMTPVLARIPATN